MSFSEWKKSNEIYGNHDVFPAFQVDCQTREGRI